MYIAKNLHLFRNVRPYRIFEKSHQSFQHGSPLTRAFAKNSKSCFSFWQSSSIIRRFPFNGRCAIILSTLGIGTLAFASSTMMKEKVTHAKTHSDSKTKHRQYLMYSPFEGKKIFQYLNSYPLSFWAISCINLMVFVFWRVPKFNLTMRKHFTSSLYDLKKGRFHTLLTSCFSHSTPMHLGFNTLCFMSLSPIWSQILGSSHFIFFYLTAGVLSSFSWCAWQGINAMVCRLAIRHSTSAVNAIIHQQSLGASGAICGLFALHTLAFPDSLFRLIFLPIYSFTAENCLKGLVIFDTCGLILSLFGIATLFGHAAHLGGVGVGWSYYEYYLKSHNRYIRRRRKSQSAI